MQEEAPQAASLRLGFQPHPVKELAEGKSPYALVLCGYISELKIPPRRTLQTPSAHRFLLYTDEVLSVIVSAIT